MRPNDAAPLLTRCAAVDTDCATADQNCAAVDALACARVSPHTPLRTGALWRAASGADSARWQIVVALLLSPEREARRLARLLERWPAEQRRHELADDVKRRYWTRHG